MIKDILKYLATSVMILLFAGIMAGWTMQTPVFSQDNRNSISSTAEGDQIYGIDSIHDWMFLRQSQNSNNFTENRVPVLKHIPTSPLVKPANKLMQAARNGILAHADQTLIVQSVKTHNYYYILSLRRIII